MVDRHVTTQAPWMIRALGVLVLLAGIVIMHTSVSATASTTAPSHEHAAAFVHEQPAQAAGDHASHVMPGEDAGHDGHHAAAHPCVFILAALALVMGLVLLYRRGSGPDTGSAAKAFLRHGHRERPPPWTMPTLAELSILRI